MKLRRLVSSVLVLGCVLLVAACGGRESSSSGAMLEFRLWWDDVKELKAGDELIYKNTVLGTVASVELRPHPIGGGGVHYVGVAVDSLRHAGILDHRMEFLIRNREDGPGNYILAKDTKEMQHSRTPIEDGDLVQGNLGGLDRFAEQVQEWTADLQDRVRSAELNEEFSRLLEDAESYLEEMQDEDRREEMLQRLQEIGEETGRALTEFEEDAKEFLESLIKKQ